MRNYERAEAYTNHRYTSWMNERESFFAAALAKTVTSWLQALWKQRQNDDVKSAPVRDVSETAERRREGRRHTKEENKII